MAETIYATKGLLTPLVKGLNLSDDDYEIVRLAVGGNTAIVGDFVSYKGKVTAATPTTHRDVNLAAAVAADDQTANQGVGWCGQIMEPVLVPDPVSGVAWDPSVALIDGTLVKILKRGARAVTAAVAIDTAGHDHLPGEFMCTASAGAVKPMINTITDTTPTTPELAIMLIQLTMECIGRMDAVAEDISQEVVVFIEWSGY